MARARVAVLISGRGSNMGALLYASRREDCPYELALVCSNDPDAAGLALARAEGIPTFAHAHAGLKRAEHDRLMEAEIEAAGASYIALAGYMRLLSAEFANRWQGRILNIHPSLLPAYKGLDVQARALADGQTVSGCTVHLVTPELDDGPILGQTRVAILPGDAPETLAARILLAEHQLYPAVLSDYVSRESSPAWLLERIRERAMTQPAAYEKLSHGMTAFGIEGGKMFCYFTRDHHGDGVTAILVKISGTDEQAMLIESDPDRYYRPAYFGDGWIGIRLDRGGIEWNHIGEWIGKSWALVAPARLRKLHGAALDF